MRDMHRERTIVRLVAFDEAPAIDVNHTALLAILASQHVKATDHLTKPLTDLSGPRLFLVGKVRYEASRRACAEVDAREEQSMYKIEHETVI